MKEVRKFPVKNKILNRLASADRLFSLIFGLTIFAFFAVLYPFHLNYQEQYQMFLFTPEYLSQFLGKPGGISDYLGNFFTQFYFYSGIGAFIIALLLVLLQRAVGNISEIQDTNSWLYPLTAIPSVLYWALLCDENYLLGGLISVLIAVGFLVLYMRWRNHRMSFILVLACIPVLYWLAGGSFVVLPLFAGIDMAVNQKTAVWRKVVLGMAGLALVVVIPQIGKLIAMQYPVERLITGVNFYRFPVNRPLPLLIILLSIVAIPLVFKYLVLRRIIRKKQLLFVLLSFLVFMASGFFIFRNANLSKEEVMAYDFHTRMRRWAAVVELAGKEMPESPLSVTCLNLALAQEGMLSNRMFNYYQNGVEGLLPEFVRDYTFPMVAGEVYYHLGFVNTAQRYAFEAMEALPDYQKSVRAVMRLAETNIINGEYAVARKYLAMLQKTFYYRKWASKASEIMKSEELVEAHPEWGNLRKFQTREDFLFSEGEKDMMLGIFFRQNHENWMAFEYLMAWCLLNKDLEHFWQYFPLIQSLEYSSVPVSYQEAMLYWWELSGRSRTQPFPFPVNDAVSNRFRQFWETYRNSQNPESALKEKFSDTYWYYYQFR